MNDKSFLQSNECDDLAKLMETKYAVFLNGRKISISTKMEAPGVWVQVVLANVDRSFYYPMEARMDHEAENLSAHQAMLFLIDYIDLYLAEYLGEDDNLFIPIDWTKYQYDAVNFEMRGQVLNLKAEAMADVLLKGQIGLHS